MKIKHILLCVSLIAGKLCCTAQDAHTIDSITAVVSKANEDSTKVAALLNLSRIYLAGEPHKAIPWAEKAKDLSIKLDYQRGLALAYKNIGIAHYQLTAYDSALIYWNQSLEVFKELNDIKLVANM